MGDLVWPTAIALFLGGGALAFIETLLQDRRRRRGSFVARRRGMTRLTMTAATCIAIGIALGSSLSRIEFYLDRPHLEEIQRRAKPIVEAIERFQVAELRRPASLEELVPKYLHEVPATGWSAHPDFEYGSNYAEQTGLFVQTGRWTF